MTGALSDKGMSGGGSACAEALWQGGAGPSHVTERSPRCLLNTEKGEPRVRLKSRAKPERLDRP